MRAVVYLIVAGLALAAFVNWKGGGVDAPGAICIDGSKIGCNPHPDRIDGRCVVLVGDAYKDDPCDDKNAVEVSSNPSGASGDMGAVAYGGAYSRDQIRDLWIRHGGDPTLANMAVAIALAESGGRPGAVNHNTDGSVDRGLWQINSIHGAQSTYDPDGNAVAAIQLQRQQGWDPWVSYTRGAYTKYL